jgi:hypothetical protein
MEQSLVEPVPSGMGPYGAGVEDSCYHSYQIYLDKQSETDDQDANFVTLFIHGILQVN